MNMIFGVKDRPKFGQTILFAIQQLLAIMAATLVVPVITNGATGSTLSPAAALFGAGYMVVLKKFYQFIVPISYCSRRKTTKTTAIMRIMPEYWF